MSNKTLIFIIVLCHLAVLAIPPRCYEPDETTYLYSGRNLIRGKWIISLEELAPQIREAQNSGYIIGPNPLGYTHLEGNRYTLSKPFFFPLIAGFFDRYITFRLINLFFSLMLFLFSWIYIRHITKNWPLFLALLYLNPACFIMLSRPLMSDFASMVCIFLSFMSFYLILKRDIYPGIKTMPLYFILFFCTLASPLLRLPNIIILPVILPFAAYEIIKRGFIRHSGLVLAILLAGLAFLSIYISLNIYLYEKPLWSGYHQTQNIKRVSFPFAFMKVIAPGNVNLKGILFRNFSMLMRDMLLAYPVLFMLLLTFRTEHGPPGYFLLISLIWILFIFFQYKVPMNLHFIFILRMFLPAAGFASLLTSLHLHSKNRLAAIYSIIFMAVLSIISYISYLVFSNTVTSAEFRLIPLIWNLS